MKLLLFTLPKCPHCPAAEEVVRKVAPDYGENGLIYDGKIRLKTNEGKELARRYNVRGTPTVILVNNDGSVIKRFVGAPDESSLRKSFFRRLFAKNL